MANISFAIPTGRSLDAISSFWQWWLGELAALIPRKPGTITTEITDENIIITRNAAKDRVQVLSAPRDGANALEPELLKTLKQATSKNEPTIILLPYNHALRRTVHVPLAAGKNLSRILGYELERQSPIDPDKVCFDYRVQFPDRHSNKLDVRMRIVRRDRVEAAIVLCRSLGLVPVGLDFAGDMGGSDGGNIILNPKTTLFLRLKRWIFVVLSLLAFVLAVSTVFAAYNRQVLLSIMIEDEIASAKAEGQIVDDLREKIAETRQHIAFPARQRRQPLLGSVLTGITRATPDGTWIFEFELQRPEAHVRGYSPVAPSLIEMFDGSPTFGKAQFRAQLTQGQVKGQERFDLAFEVKESAK